MGCGKYRQLIYHHTGGLLSDQQVELLERHLAECRQCADLQAHAGTALQALRALSAPEPPSGLGVRIKAAAWTQRARLRRVPVWKTAVTATAAALVITVIAVLVIGGLQSHSRFESIALEVSPAPAPPPPAVALNPSPSVPPVAVVLPAEREADSSPRPRRLPLGLAMAAAREPRVRPEPLRLAAAPSSLAQTRVVVVREGSRAPHAVMTPVMGPAPLSMAEQRTATLPPALRPGGGLPSSNSLGVAGEVVSGLVAGAVIDQYLSDYLIQSGGDLPATATSSPSHRAGSPVGEGGQP